jgi:hypothetical protein
MSTASDSSSPIKWVLCHQKKDKDRITKLVPVKAGYIGGSTLIKHTTFGATFHLIVAGSVMSKLRERGYRLDPPLTWRDFCHYVVDWDRDLFAEAVQETSQVLLDVRRLLVTGESDGEKLEEHTRYFPGAAAQSDKIRLAVAIPEGVGLERFSYGVCSPFLLIFSAANCLARSYLYILPGAASSEEPGSMREWLADAGDRKYELMHVLARDKEDVRDLPTLMPSFI